MGVGLHDDGAMLLVSAGVAVTIGLVTIPRLLRGKRSKKRTAVRIAPAEPRREEARVG